MKNTTLKSTESIQEEASSRTDIDVRLPEELKQFIRETYIGACKDLYADNTLGCSEYHLMGFKNALCLIAGTFDVALAGELSIIDFSIGFGISELEARELINRLSSACK